MGPTSRKRRPLFKAGNRPIVITNHIVTTVLLGLLLLCLVRGFVLTYGELLNKMLPRFHTFNYIILYYCKNQFPLIVIFAPRHIIPNHIVSPLIKFFVGSNQNLITVIYTHALIRSFVSILVYFT